MYYAIIDRSAYPLYEGFGTPHCIRVMAFTTLQKRDKYVNCRQSFDPLCRVIGRPQAMTMLEACGKARVLWLDPIDSSHIDARDKVVFLGRLRRKNYARP